MDFPLNSPLLSRDLVDFGFTNRTDRSREDRPKAWGFSPSPELLYYWSGVGRALGRALGTRAFASFASFDEPLA